MMTRRRATLLVAVTTLFVVTAVWVGAHDRSRNATRIANIDQFDPRTYYDLWHGDVSLLSEPAHVIARDEWQRLLDEEDSVGLLRMQPDDRVLLLKGAAKAYLLSVFSTTRRIDTDDGTSLVREQYQTDSGLYVVLKAREQQSSGVITDWPDLTFTQSGLTQHDRVFVDVSGGDVVFQTWTQDDQGTWTCKASQDEGGLGFASVTYLGELAGFMHKGTVIRGAAFNGRSAVLFELDDRGSEIGKVWVDTRTLLPIGFTWPQYAIAGAPGPSMPARTVRILAFNTDDPIERPAGDCPKMTP